MGRNVVLGARHAGVSRLLNLGSSCIYPRDAPNPLQESSILRGQLEPTNEGYALAKIMVLRLCQYVSQEDSSKSYKTLIPCNLYGPHDNFSPGEAHLIPSLIHRMHEARMDGRAAVTMWGDGTARREFMFVADLADCVCEAVGRFDSLPGLMNVGPGKDHSVAEYYGAVARVVGYEGRFIPDLSKPVGMQRKLVDTSIARVWGWTSRTPLEEGLRATYRFYLDQIKGSS